MSAAYIERLKTIQEELNAASVAIAFISKNLHRPELLAEKTLEPYQKGFYELVGKNLDVTYFVRLTAEFEGILKDHLRNNHPSVSFPPKKADWKVDWFLSKVLKAESLRIDPNLRQKLDEVRDYRNSLAHGGETATPVTFSDALKRYNIFLAKLPNPSR